MNAMERRNADIVRRYRAGENLASIGAALDLTRERVRQLVKQSGAHMPLDYMCAVKGCSTSPRTPKQYCYAHRRRLELYGDPLGARLLLRDQHGTLASYMDRRCRCDLCRRAEADRRLEYDHRRFPERQYRAQKARSN